MLAKPLCIMACIHTHKPAGRTYNSYTAIGHNNMQKIGVKSGYMQKLDSNEAQFFAPASIQILTIKKFYTCDKNHYRNEKTNCFKSICSYRWLALLVKTFAVIY